MKSRYSKWFLFIAFFLLTYQTFGYSTEKILSVTCNYGQGNAYGTTQNIGWGGAAFVAGTISNGPGQFYIEVHVTGNGIDQYYYKTVTGYFNFSIGYLSPGLTVHVTVVPQSGNSTTYCVADVWQWKQ